MSRPRRRRRKFARSAGRALALKADLADAAGVGAAIDRAAAEFGRLDVLVQAAGAMGAWHETAELSTDDWDRYLAVDLSGAFYVIRASAAAPAQGRRRRDRGDLVDRRADVPGAQRAGRRRQGRAGGDGARRGARGGTARHPRQCGGGRPDRHRHGACRFRGMGSGDRPSASSAASRCAGSARRKRSRAWSAFWPGPTPPTSPARCCRSMAGRSSRRECRLAMRNSRIMASAVLARKALVAFETRLTPAMAARWRGAGLWSDETFATVLARGLARRPIARR